MNLTGFDPAKPLKTAIDVADLGNEGGVIRGDQRRPQLLDDLAAAIFENTLES